MVNVTYMAYYLELRFDFTLYLVILTSSLDAS